MINPSEALLNKTISNFSNSVYGVNETEATEIVMNFSGFASLLLKLVKKKEELKNEKKQSWWKTN